MAERYFVDSVFNLAKTIESGQVFRFNCLEEQTYQVWAGDRTCILCQEGDTVYVHEAGGDRGRSLFWVKMFGLYDLCDYEVRLKQVMSRTPKLQEIYSFSKGIRLIRQDPWESLISFIISQNNNIPRIKKCIEAVCNACSFGDKALGERAPFPLPREICEADLSGCGLGYRETYVKSTAEAVISNTVDLSSLTVEAGVTVEEAIDTLLKLQGIGPKVAQCVALFGLGHTEIFPRDVWINRAIESNFISEEFIISLGDLRGIVQQYLFYYMLNGG